MNVTGYTGYGQVRTEPGGELLADFIVDATSDPTNGVVTADLDATDTSTLTSGSVYEIRLEADSVPYVFAKGSVILEKAVYQP